MGGSVRKNLFKRIRNNLLAGLTAWGVRALLTTLRYEVSGWERVKLEAWHGPGIIYCFWHNNIMLPLGHESRRHTTGIMSLGADGEYAARVMRHFGVSALRGSSSRGGAALVRQVLARARDRSIFAVTPDGPRGPRYHVAPGIAYLASRTGIPVAPVGMAVSRAWKLRSWDRFRIPKPFARAYLVFGDPIHIPRSADKTALDGALKRLEEDMERLSRDASRKAGHAWPD